MKKVTLGRIYSDVSKTWYCSPGTGFTGVREKAHIYTKQAAEEHLAKHPPSPKWGYRFVPLAEQTPEPVGHIFCASEGCWFKAPGLGVTKRPEEAHRYTASAARKVLARDVEAALYEFVPLPGQVSRPDSSEPAKPTIKPALEKLYSFRGQPNVGRILRENPTAEHLLLEINDPGKAPYWKIVSKKFASERILDNKEQALKTFEMLTEPEPTPEPKFERWVLAWDGRRHLSPSEVPSLFAMKPGDPFAVVRIRGKEAWYFLRGNVKSENTAAISPKEAWARVEEARQKALGPRVKVFGSKEK